MFGTIRLVNPYRGVIPAVICGNLTLTTSNSGRNWDVHYRHIFWPGRGFSFKEIRNYALQTPQILGVTGSSEQRAADRLVEALLESSDPAVTVADIDREVVMKWVKEEMPDPINSHDPKDWTWYAISFWGEKRLERQQRPTMSELSSACREALVLKRALDLGKSLERLDTWELWVEDYFTQEPVALVVTAVNERDLGEIFWDPKVRLLRPPADDPKFEEKIALIKEQEKKLNDRICPHRNWASIRTRIVHNNKLIKRLVGRKEAK